jgi:single-strand DNA-binding protein
MLNKVLLQARLGNDAELKTSSNGISVVTLNVAVKRDFKNKNGENETDWLTVVIWRQTAEMVAKYFKKGDQILIEGSIQTRKYTDKDGNNRTAFEIVANNVHFVESKKSADVNVGVDPLPDFANRLNEFNNANNTQNEDMFSKIDDDMPF